MGLKILILTFLAVMTGLLAMAVNILAQLRDSLSANPSAADRKKLKPAVEQPDEDELREKREELKRRVMDAVEKKYLDADFCERDLSKVVGTNLSYLSSVINNDLGMNFNKLLRKKRIGYAVSLMNDDPRQRVCDLYSKCGYQTETTFSAHFKAEIHTTPANYMRGLLASQGLGRQLPDDGETPFQD